MKKFFSRFSYPIELYIHKSERSFLAFIVCCFIAAMFASPFPEIAMWVGFLFAAYAAVANDSIQTIGTFIASNQDKKWWILWIFLGGIFVFTMFYSWSKIDETGVTVFSEQKEFLKDANDDCLVPGCKEESVLFSITEKTTESSLIIWGLEKQNTIDTIEYDQNYKDVSYIDPDYGIGFFITDVGDLCQVIGMVKDSSTTYNQFVQIEYKNLITHEVGRKDIEYAKNGELKNITFSLFPDGNRDGDVSNGRLASKGYEQSPKRFHFLQIAAPIFLLILTRLRMPVSTTFILLTSFAATPAAVGKVLAKSMSGYILAFLIGFIVFITIAKLAKKYFTGKAHFSWTIAQWVTSGTLWSVWLMQDAANIAVYLPRGMNFGVFFGFVAIIFFGLGLLLYYKGGRIQKIVTEKSVVTDVRFATLIDFIYCILLFYFKLHSKVPMSTTWVFIGLLGGRELGMALRRSGENSIGKTFKLIFKDFSFAMIGLVISIAIAIGVNDNLNFTSMMEDLPAEFVSGISKFFSRLGF